MGYNVYSLSPLLIAAQTAKNTGRDWYAYENNGKSLNNCFTFLAGPDAVKPGSDWMPTMYGNLSNEPIAGSGQTAGDYGDLQAQKVLSDKRGIFELAQQNIPHASYHSY